MLSCGSKEAALKAMMELELSHQQFSQIVECSKCQEAYDLIEKLYEAVRLLLIMK